VDKAEDGLHAALAKAGDRQRGRLKRKAAQRPAAGMDHELGQRAHQLDQRPVLGGAQRRGDHACAAPRSPGLTRHSTTRPAVMSAPREGSLKVCTAQSTFLTAATMAGTFGRAASSRCLA
jgi:hypothetical protein